MRNAKKDTELVISVIINPEDIPKAIARQILTEYDTEFVNVNSVDIGMNVLKKILKTRNISTCSDFIFNLVLLYTLQENLKFCVKFRIWNEEGCCSHLVTEAYADSHGYFSGDVADMIPRRNLKLVQEINETRIRIIEGE